MDLNIIKITNETDIHFGTRWISNWGFAGLNITESAEEAKLYTLAQAEHIALNLNQSYAAGALTFTIVPLTCLKNKELVKESPNAHFHKIPDVPLDDLTEFMLGNYTDEFEANSNYVLTEAGQYHVDVPSPGTLNVHVSVPGHVGPHEISIIEENGCYGFSRVRVVQTFGYGKGFFSVLLFT